MIGPHADIFTAGGYSGKVTDPVTPLQGIKNRVADGTEILFAKGGEIAPPRRAPRTPFNREEELRRAAEIAAKADVAVVYVGTTLDIEAEGRDRATPESAWQSGGIGRDSPGGEPAHGGCVDERRAAGGPLDQGARAGDSPGVVGGRGGRKLTVLDEHLTVACAKGAVRLPSVPRHAGRKAIFV